jgi:hypothetical protein
MDACARITRLTGSPERGRDDGILPTGGNVIRLEHHHGSIEMRELIGDPLHYVDASACFDCSLTKFDA